MQPTQSNAGEASPVLHVVLVEPEIPPNTGTIARLCAATGTRLHLIRPLGFSLDDRYLKRAGLDYWPQVDLLVHDDWKQFVRTERPERLLFFSARAERPYVNVAYSGPPPVYLVFGSETRGLAAPILATHTDHCYRIPIFNAHVRSLNLANAVAIVLYEALRQRGRLE